VGGIRADQTASFELMRDKLTRFIRILGDDPAVASTTGFTGGGRSNTGFVFVALKPLAERDVSAVQVVARLRPKLAQVAGALSRDGDRGQLERSHALAWRRRDRLLRLSFLFRGVLRVARGIGGIDRGLLERQLR